VSLGAVPVPVGNKHQLMPWWMASLGGLIRASNDETLPNWDWHCSWGHRRDAYDTLGSAACVTLNLPITQLQKIGVNL
jgi:hypothetical protein